jgi:hypothetical protein
MVFGEFRHCAEAEEVKKSGFFGSLKHHLMTETATGNTSHGADENEK